jgi:hypothetical protein
MAKSGKQTNLNQTYQFDKGSLDPRNRLLSHDDNQDAGVARLRLNHSQVEPKKKYLKQFNT